MKASTQQLLASIQQLLAISLIPIMSKLRQTNNNYTSKHLFTCITQLLAYFKLKKIRTIEKLYRDVIDGIIVTFSFLTCRALHNTPEISSIYETTVSKKNRVNQIIVLNFWTSIILHPSELHVYLIFSRIKTIFAKFFQQLLFCPVLFCLLTQVNLTYNLSEQLGQPFAQDPSSITLIPKSFNCLFNCFCPKPRNN